MAFSHRKSLSVSVNITIPAGLFCLSFCDPKINSSGLCPESCMSTCPQVCQHSIPKLPPTPSEHHHRHLIDFHSFYPVFIFITVLAAIFFLAYCFVIYLKIYRRGSSSNLELQQGDATTHDQEFLEEIHGPVLDHPIWYINTIGLQPSVIAAIAVFRYRKDDGLIELKDCTVCLSEFEEGDAIRLLPKCSHAFHVSCIDTWLRSHTNCPMCRSGIVSELVLNSDTIHVPSNNENPAGSMEEVHIAVNSDGREEFGGDERDDKGVEDRSSL